MKAAATIGTVGATIVKIPAADILLGLDNPDKALTYLDTAVIRIRPNTKYVAQHG